MHTQWLFQIFIAIAGPRDLAGFMLAPVDFSCNK